jgi:GNAT superfamily N-acetyltransferase
VSPNVNRSIPPAGIDLSDAVTVVPANEASWADLRAIFGDRGYAAYCQCQRFKVRDWAEWNATPVPERMDRLRRQTHCDDPDASVTSGLVAYFDGEPVGWCAVEPRTAYPRLPPARTAFKPRREDKDDGSVWAVTCFATRAGFRRRGITRALARATVDFARQRGAQALEAYPMITEPGQEITWGETHVGTRSIFADAGFSEVFHPTLRRVVMRIDFCSRSASDVGGARLVAERRCDLLRSAVRHRGVGGEDDL